LDGPSAADGRVGRLRKTIGSPQQLAAVLVMGLPFSHFITCSARRWSSCAYADGHLRCTRSPTRHCPERCIEVHAAESSRSSSCQNYRDIWGCCRMVLICGKGSAGLPYLGQYNVLANITGNREASTMDMRALRPVRLRPVQCIHTIMVSTSHVDQSYAGCVAPRAGAPPSLGGAVVLASHTGLSTTGNV
jgi:hypothetical protein